jgi:hypothetical protein
MATQPRESSPSGRPDSHKLGRRDFLVVAGSGLTLAFFCQEYSRVAEAQIAGPPPNTQVNTWLNISNTGVITLRDKALSRAWRKFWPRI